MHHKKQDSYQQLYTEPHAESSNAYMHYFYLHVAHTIKSLSMEIIHWGHLVLYACIAAINCFME